MLAARDQENLVHGHQAAAASKQLNQGMRQLPPKTPGNKVPKTPFKIPLNDENGIIGNEGGKTGKTGLKLNGKGNENLTIGGKKGGLVGQNAYITPLGPRNRAPLGLKTTNAKAKAFQTPAPVLGQNDVGKATQKSAAARKPKPKVAHAEMTKVDVQVDQDILEEREIEYMPPPAKDLPDLPDDMPHSINLSMFENGGLTHGSMEHFASRPDASGLGYLQRREREEQEWYNTSLAKDEALLLREVDSIPMPCVHEPECPGDECVVNTEIRRKAEEKYQNTIAALSKKPASVEKKVTPSNGPTATISKYAATALSHSKPPVRTTVKPPPKPSAPFSLKPKFPSSILSTRKKTPPPTNPSPMRHTAAAAASKTTMGYSKGRAAAANLQKSVLAPTDAGKPEIPDTTLAPAAYIQRYGIPAEGTEIWARCRRLGCFDEDDGGDDGWMGGRDLMREEAERDFELTW